MPSLLYRAAIQGFITISNEDCHSLGYKSTYMFFLWLQLRSLVFVGQNFALTFFGVCASKLVEGAPKQSVRHEFAQIVLFFQNRSLTSRTTRRLSLNPGLAIYL